MSEESEAIDNLSDNLTVLFGASTLQLVGIKTALNNIKSVLDDIETGIRKMKDDVQLLTAHIGYIRTDINTINTSIDEIAKTDTELELEFYGTPKTLITRLKSQNVAEES